jgi:hypothetical protein
LQVFVGIYVLLAGLVFALLAAAAAATRWTDKHLIDSESQSGQDDYSDDYLIHRFPPLSAPGLRLAIIWKNRHCFCQIRKTNLDLTVFVTLKTVKSEIN